MKHTANLDPLDPALTLLAHLPVGVFATVCYIDAQHELTARLRALGIKPGSRVSVVRSAPLSGPLQVRSGQTDIILRRAEAAAIHVNPTF
ncbi:MAG: ferrous iron transport protein A [Betaproteobacteria bacterium]|jgi:ferrous iron transport protein A|nr:MAG: ferrous iron transport protein A [Betaproteobacteria bacterium]